MGSGRNEISGSVFGISVQAGAIHGDVHLYGQAANAVATKFAGSPYRGLLPFAQDHQDVFYGRERLTGELVDRVADRLTGSGLLMVTGASGVGKSSLVQAGLVPAVAAGRLAAGCESWPRVVMTPTNHPVDELAIRLAALAGVTASSMRDILLERPTEAAQLVRQAVLVAPATDDHAAGTATAAPTPRLLLVVDQFEELFTLIPDTQPEAVRQRDAFLAALCAATTTGVGPTNEPALLVVLAVRSDFWHHCLAVPVLGELMREGQFIVGPMTEPELRRAITGPATAAGLHVEPELTDLVLADLRAMSSPTGFDAGALPLLSQAMLMTWERRCGDQLTIQAYSTTGGVANAITTSAERVYTRLDPHDQAVTETVFHQLAMINNNGLATRRTATRTALYTSTPHTTPECLDKVLAAFADERLLVLNNGNVDIAHDSLLIAWPRLQDWLAEDHTDHLIHHQLADDATRWQHSNQDKAFLYRGTELTTARNALARWDTNSDRYPTPTPQIRHFLHTSIQADHRTTNLRRTAVTALVLLIIATSITALIAITTAQESRRQQLIALSRQLAARADAITNTNPGLAQRLAAAAWHITPTPEAHYSMLNTLATRHRTVLTNHTRPVNGVAFSPDGKTLATASDDHTARLWNTTTHRQIGATLTSYAAPVSDVAFSPDGNTLATADFDHVARLWNVASHHQINKPLTGHTDPVNSVAFSPDGQILATASDDHTARLWDVVSHRQIGDPLTGHTDSVRNVAFSPDGKVLATASWDETVRLWDVVSHRQIGNLLTGHTGIYFSLAFSPDGTTLATASDSQPVRLWGVASRRQIGEPLTNHAVGATFSPDSKTLATASDDGSVRLWDVASRRQIGEPLTGHAGMVFDVAFSPDGNTLATASDDRTVRLWDMVPHRQIGDPLTGHTLTVDSVAFSPDGNTLATTGNDQTVRLWDVTSHHQIDDPAIDHTHASSAVFSPDGNTLATIDGSLRLWDATSHRQIGDPFAEHILDVAFSPDGNTLATTSWDRTVRLWDVATHRQIGAPLTGHSVGVSSAAFSPDGNTLVTATNDGILRLWDAASHRQIGDPFAEHILDVAFSPDSNTLATSQGESVRLWDAASHRQIGDPLTGHTDTVDSVASARTATPSPPPATTGPYDYGT
jgi:WD40 repeat protein